MRCYCPKCGRMIEVTAQEAARLGGHLVCPQCLSRVDVAVPMAKTAATSKSEAAPAPKSAPRAQAQPSDGPFCPKCGAKVRAADAFCKSCGASLGTARRKADAGAPPPYRSRRPAAQAPAYRAPQPVRPAVPRPAPARRPAQRKAVQSSPAMSGMGCMWRTAVGVAVAFALYVLLGAAFQ